MVRVKKNTDERVREAREEGEKYAIVMRMNGPNCNVKTVTGEDLLGHLRGKMSGRNRRQCNISKGSIVLVGLHEWEKTPKNCDILEVYTPQEIEQLKTLPKAHFERLIPILQSLQQTATSTPIAVDVMNEIEFTNPVAQANIVETVAAEEDPSTFTSSYENINIDDI
jgi:initiation factor 1A